VDYDTEKSYGTMDSVYTIVIGETYVFSLQFCVPLETTFSVDLIRKRANVETIIQQITNGNNTSVNNSSYNLTTISEVQTNDEVFGKVSSGSVRLVPSSEVPWLRLVEVV
jgi:hypothetical protein